MSGPHRRNPRDAAVGRVARRGTDAAPRSRDLVQLIGVQLGNSPRRTHWRLYRTAALDRCFEFRKKDTVDAERLAGGEIVVWLSPGAAAEMVDAKATVEFLRGGFERDLDRISRWGAIRRILVLEHGGLCGNGPGPGQSVSVTACEGGSCTQAGMPGCASSISVC